MADIFLSYARADYDTAVKVRDALEALDPDLEVFWDVVGLDAGDVFPERLADEVRDARAVLGLWNDHALSREWVNKEVDIAVEQKTLIPVEIGPVTEKVITLRLSKIHRTKLHDFDGSADHPGWQETVRALARMLQRPDLIRARKDRVKEEARAKRLEADLAKQRARNERLQKSKGGARPWQWAVGGLVSLALAAGAGFWAMQWQQSRYIDQIEGLNLRVRLAGLDIKNDNSVTVVRDILDEGVELARLESIADEDAGAALLAGFAYFFGEGTEQDDAKAVDLLLTSCDSGSGLACFSVGWMHKHGRGVEVDEPRAVELYRKACDGSDVDGCNNLGFMHEKGWGVEKDLIQAAYHYQESCDLGGMLGCKNLGGMYENGRGVDKDEFRAFDLYQQSCDGGEPEGCINLGVMYENGRAVEQDYDRAVDFYRDACDGGEALGCRNLGWMYDNGRGVEEDELLAVDLYGQSCDGGDMGGCTNLGVMYEYGRGVDADPAYGAELYEIGCDGGDMLGCTNLGIMYANGTGVDQDDSKAIEYYKIGCKGDDAKGCSALGNWTYLGLGGLTVNKEEGIRLLRQGCDGGEQWGCDKLVEHGY
ncbi:MAG: TIR domain-containing protein [Pseudomonadota bacterium]